MMCKENPGKSIFQAFFQFWGLWFLLTEGDQAGADRAGQSLVDFGAHVLNVKWVGLKSKEGF